MDEPMLTAAERAEIDRIIDGAQLLDDVRAYICRYLVLSDHQSAALALWVLHTWTIEAVEATPYIRVTSVTKECGKTRLLETLEMLVRRPWRTGKVSPAALVRKISRDHPTLLLDETDAAFKGDKESAEALRGVLNNGYLRGGKHSLCVGKNHDVQDFEVFSPKALAGIGFLPDTIVSRSITIELVRRAKNERVEKFRWRNAKGNAAEIVEKLAVWASHAIETLCDARPNLPDELSDRQEDVWEPLIAIADLVGNPWPARSREAAKSLSARGVIEDTDSIILLLSDTHAVFNERGINRIASADLARALTEREESPWGSRPGEVFDAKRLAAILKPIKIKPKSIRIGEKTPKGYERVQFEDAWRRYTPTLVEQQHPQHRNNPDFARDSFATLAATSSATETSTFATPPEVDVGASMRTNAAVADALRQTPATLRVSPSEISLFDGLVADVADVASSWDGGREETITAPTPKPEPPTTNASHVDGAFPGSGRIGQHAEAE